MITFAKTKTGGVIHLDDSDLETVKLMLHRALNTWQPNPPQDLLRVQRQIEALNG